jgi:hypothetical protein
MAAAEVELLSTLSEIETCQLPFVTELGRVAVIQISRRLTAPAG